MPPYGLMASAHLMTALVRQRRGEEAAVVAREDLAWLGRIGGPVCAEVMCRVAAADALFSGGDRGAAESALRGALHQIEERAAAMTDTAVKEAYLTGREENRRAAELARAWRLDEPSPGG